MMHENERAGMIVRDDLMVWLSESEQRSIPTVLALLHALESPLLLSCSLVSLIKILHQQGWTCWRAL